MIFSYRFTTTTGLRLSQLNYKSCRTGFWSGLRTTYFPQANQGFWKFGDITYRDEIVIYRVISQDSSASREYLTKLKEHLKQEFQQLDILIIEREVGLL